MVRKRRADERIKKVAIHGLLHEIFIREAAKPQNNSVFMSEFQEFVGGAYGRHIYLDSAYHRALECLSKITNLSSSDHVQSFLYFPSSSIIAIEEIPEEVMAAIPNAFPNLQVLDIKGFRFPRKQLPKELYSLRNLTYLGITILDLKLLPKEFGSLTQLQTLVLDIITQNSTCVKIEADIWSCMPNLKHLLTNTSSLQLQLPSPIIRSRITGRKKSSSSSGVVSSITTLSTISPTSCTQEILDKTPKLQTLGIRGKLVDDQSNSGSGILSLLDKLHNLRHLENLKLFHHYPKTTTLLQRFPEANKFPQRLRKLSLGETSFEWKDFGVLGALNQLEILKLKEYAFRGESWELSDDVVFRCLQFLHIGRSNLANWKTSKTCFPVLRTLYISGCDELKAIPSDFADLDSLQHLELFCTTKEAEQSARMIQNLKREKGNNPKSSSRGLLFNLSIY